MKSLREARKAKGVTARAVARHIGVTERTYYNYEEHPEKVSIATAKAICDYLGYTLDEIFLAESVN